MWFVEEHLFLPWSAFLYYNWGLMVSGFQSEHLPFCAFQGGKRACSAGQVSKRAATRSKLTTEDNKPKKRTTAESPRSPAGPFAVCPPRTAPLTHAQPHSPNTLSHSATVWFNSSLFLITNIVSRAQNTIAILEQVLLCGLNIKIVLKNQKSFSYIMSCAPYILCFYCLMVNNMSLLLYS